MGMKQMDLFCGSSLVMQYTDRNHFQVTLNIGILLYRLGSIYSKVRKNHTHKKNDMLFKLFSVITLLLMVPFYSAPVVVLCEKWEMRNHVKSMKINLGHVRSETE